MGGDRRLHEPQQQWCTRSWGLHTVRGGIVRGDNRFRLRLFRVVNVWKVFFSDDGIVWIAPGCRWLNEPQPISNQLVGLGCPHRKGGIDSEDHRFGLWFVNLVCMEGYLIWG